MIGFAEREFRLDRSVEGGGTERDHLRSAAAQIAKLGLRPKRDLAAATEARHPPEATIYLWRWFCQHSAGLALSGMAPPVVTWEGLAAWASLMGVVLDPWEALAMVRLGRLRARILSEKAEAESRRRGANP